MFSRSRLRPVAFRRTPHPTARSRRTLTAAPGPNTGPFLERRPDRELPSLTSSNRWLRTLPIFVAIMVGSALAIFNYQKSNSSIVSSTMYALRTSPQAREILGDEIYFASQLPWISGEMNQLHGVIDISFWVKGTRGKGKMRFRSERKTRMGYFETVAWTLEPEGGEMVSLLQAEGRDPFLQETADKVTVKR